jgi:hypothetical protein
MDTITPQINAIYEEFDQFWNSSECGRTRRYTALKGRLENAATASGL